MSLENHMIIDISQDLSLIFLPLLEKISIGGGIRLSNCKNFMESLRNKRFECQHYILIKLESSGIGGL